MVWKKIISLVFVVSLAHVSVAQFYNGYSQEFGKNRIQYDEFNWNHYDFKRFNVYFYEQGEINASYTAQVAEEIIKELEERFDYYLEEKIEFVLYNSQNHYRQTNVGIDDEVQNDIGGVMKARDSKVFLYFEGNHTNLEAQIRGGVANILIHRLMLGKNWKEVVKNSALLTIPDWYIDGLVSYVSQPESKAVEDQIKDGVITGRYHEFNRLSGEEAIYAGHAIWSYIAKTYGEKVIPNILYMSRLSRNVESGFLYVVGLSLKSLNKETIAYYKEYYRDTEKYGEFPSGEVGVKINEKKKYSQLKVSPGGDYVVYVENELGKYRVMLHEFSTGKTKKILKGGTKTGWMPDYSYPILQWHPNGKSVAIVTEKKADNYITFFRIEENDKVTKPLLKFERVLDMAYAPDGKTMVMSAVRNGQTDLYQYNVVSNYQKQLTDDIYDDINPTFLSQSKIIFSSNRYDDTLRLSKKTEQVAASFDLFLFNMVSRKNVLKRVTNTPEINETQPLRKDTAHFIYLSDEAQTVGRNIAYFDSVISHIDTAFHYRYVTVSNPVTNYSRNIIEQHVAQDKDVVVQLFFKDGKYFMSFESMIGGGAVVPKSTTEDRVQIIDEGKLSPNNIPVSNQLEYTLISIQDKAAAEVDYNDYRFGNETGEENRAKPINSPPSEVIKKEKPTRIGENDSPLVEGPVTVKEKAFRLPVAEEYAERFSALEMQTEFNFNYSSQMYQRYTGALGYMNTKIALETYATMSDLFNNHDIKGGMRFALDWSIKEYYLKYNNRAGRLNKQYVVERQTNEFPISSNKYKIEYNQTQMRLSYPLSERLRINGTGTVRYDRFIALSTEKATLRSPTFSEAQAGLKAELVYDNTTGLGLNLRKGARFKLFIETYNGIFNAQFNEGTSLGDSSIITPTLGLKPSTVIFGIDYRKYIKVHRNIVWANRFVASTSLGENKLLYYMGGVDGKVHFADKPRFNYDLPVVDGQAYNFQTVGTNVRGFMQNTRNGNNMILISSELRVPIFSYFATKPVKSDFIKNFQTVLFADVGTAWSGTNPYSDDNYFNTTVVGGEEGDPVKVILRNQDEPIISGYGFGFRSRFLSYFVKLDFAWGFEDGRINSPKSYLSVGLDF
ncbi:MAG: PD40 domain-containing protein [Flavobacteriales bacterium]|nr:PD40 domain-containing protein [Flavobacteriales bacterium]